METTQTQTQTEERTLTLETLIEESRLALTALEALNALITKMDPHHDEERTTEDDPEEWSRQDCEPMMMGAIDRLYELTDWYDEQITEREGTGGDTWHEGEPPRTDEERQMLATLLAERAADAATHGVDYC